MKKITFILTIIFTFVTGSYAQGPAGTYAFSESTEAYTAVTGTASTATGDDGTQIAIPIGFTFNFDGVNYTDFGISTNGWIRLGVTAIGTLNWTNALSNTATHQPLIAAFWDDNHRNTGSIQYVVNGIAPNRTLEVDWNNVNIGGGGSTSAVNLASYKIRLYETTNVIEIVYAPVMASAGTLTASIGLNGSASFLSVTPGATATASAGAANNNIASTANVVGKKYIFTPPVACSGTPTGGTTSPASQTLALGQASAAITVAGQSAGLTGLTYQWEESTDAGANWVNATGGTGATTLTYTPPIYAGTPILYRLRVTCTNSGLSGFSSNSAIVSCAAVTALPWTENFDGLSTLGTTSFPACWLKENGDWSTSDATVYNTARSGANYLRDAWSATNEYIWTVGFDLVGGNSYDFSTFVQGDGGTGWVVDMFYNTSPSSAGATQLGVAYSVPGSGTIAMQSYAEMKRTFVPGASGTYYFALRVNQPTTAPWYVAFDDMRLEATPACPSPSSLVANPLAHDAATITWGPTTGVYEYVLDNSAADPAGNGLALAGETYNATLLTPETTYYLHVRTDCGGTYSTWSVISFTTLATPPANDDCTNAIALTPGGVYADNPVDGTNAGATTSSQTAPTTCFGFSGDDAWYSIVVPASGSVTIETGAPVGGGAGIDTVITAYSGDCTTPTQIGCDDDNAAETAVGFSRLALSSLTPGSTILVRVYEYNNDVTGSFGISAYDASLSTGSFDSAAFKAYPNPVTNVLNLSYSSDITSVEIYNMLGQRVMVKAMNATQGQVDMSNLNTGNYIVKVTANDLIKTIKVIKQ